MAVKQDNFMGDIVDCLEPKGMKFYWAQSESDAKDRGSLGVTCDLMSTFYKHRCIALDSKYAETNVQLRNPLCGQKTSSMKEIAMQNEVHKLVNRYSENLKSLRSRSILSEVKSHPWQKLPQWIEPKNATACYKCNCRFRSLSTKINCRVGGQVFCTSCCTDQMVVYSTKEGVKWAINGKPGGPSVVPSIYCLLPVCSNCSGELQSFLSSKFAITRSRFFEQIHCLHKILFKLQFKIDSILPKYLAIIDSLSMDDGSPNSINERNPIQWVAKAHCDLVYMFDLLSTNFHKLKCLGPKSATEEKLQSNISQCTTSFLREKNTKFQVANNCLSDIMPLQDLQKVQKNVSERNIEQVYDGLKRLEFELSCLTQMHEFNCDILKILQTTLLCVEDEYSNLDMEKDVQESAHCIESTEENRLITLDPQVSTPKNIQYVVVSQISSCLGEYLQLLLNTTTEQDFSRAKESLQNASLNLDRLQLSLS